MSRDPTIDDVRPLQSSTCATLIYNPTAGGGRRREALVAAVGVLEDAGWRVRREATQAAGHASELAGQAVRRGDDLVVAAGGDGTVHEVVQGVVGSKTALGLLPAGTGNVLAGQLGLVGRPTPLHSVDLPEAAQALLESRPRPVDLGWARNGTGDERYFLLWAGVGLDAEVTRAMENEGRELKRAIGPAAFGLVGLQRLVTTRSVPSVTRLDGRPVTGSLLMGLVSNVRLYGGAFEIATDARIDDGRLDVTLFHSRGALTTLRHLIGILRGRSATHERVDAQVTGLHVDAGKPLPVHLDAEPFGTTPLRVEVRPRALRLMMPTSAPAALFSNSSPNATQPSGAVS